MMGFSNRKYSKSLASCPEQGPSSQSNMTAAPGMFKAVIADDAAWLAELLKAGGPGADINQLNAAGLTPLELACEK